MKEGLWSNLLISSTYSFPTTRQFPEKKKVVPHIPTAVGGFVLPIIKKTNKHLTSKKISDGLVK